MPIAGSVLCSWVLASLSTLKDPVQYISVIYTRRVARQYGICWFQKELSWRLGTLHIFSGMKTFLFVKIESWDFQHLFDFEFRETLQKLRSFKQHSENIFSIGIKSYLNELKSWKISRNKNWKKITIHILPKRICIWLKYSWDLLSCLGIGDFLANLDVKK